MHKSIDVSMCACIVYVCIKETYVSLYVYVFMYTCREMYDANASANGIKSYVVLHYLLSPGESYDLAAQHICKTVQTFLYSWIM